MIVFVWSWKKVRMKDSVVILNKLIGKSERKEKVTPVPSRDSVPTFCSRYDLPPPPLFSLTLSRVMSLWKLEELTQSAVQILKPCSAFPRKRVKFEGET